MSRNWIKRIRTAIAAALAGLTILAGINLGPLIDLLKRLKFDTNGLGVIDPATGTAIIGFLGVLAAIFTAFNQVLDKTPVPSLAVPPEPAHIPADAETASHLTDDAATEA